MFRKIYIKFYHSKSITYVNYLEKPKFSFALYLEKSIYLHKKIKTRYNN